MLAMERLKKHLSDRASTLRKQKNDGVKIVGYTPGGFMPEEIVHAAGAIPICLLKGGDADSVIESLKYNPRFFCTFCKTQIAYLMGGDLVYNLPDILIVPHTDCNHKLIADSWNYYGNTDVLRYGVPHNKGESARAYFKGGLEILKKKLEDLTGNKVTDEKLFDEIQTGNKIRSLLKEISFARKTNPAAISSRDFTMLQHASTFADKDFIVQTLEAVRDEINEKPTADKNRKRVMMIASSLANGDNLVFDIIENTDADIVYEEVTEGYRPYLDNVEVNGNDPIQNLSDTYFDKRVPAPWDRPWGDRMERLIEKAKEFSCGGVVWYQMMYRDGFDIQAHYFSKMLEEQANIPMVKIESDYAPAEKGPARTRIETLVEVMSAN
ncbi:MAG: 2-hydroxyacyl-CoA dehydratase [Desulfobacterium sp.]|nr:2-hydroxyacyl-CoA dehydratase [Desulfobacterium sp.]MBU3947706.1 2-hydroxyacyl-CoA dehydratase family protein [Pseudomonadota bacterium]MBU4035047.1 2-hydroxyacyl-CoA dehydratase family protein [Pseudomonadota bacterium]